MRGYLRSTPPRLCIGLLRNNHGIIVPAVLAQVMQHQETSRWQQLKQVDILAMDLHTPDTVSYTHLTDCLHMMLWNRVSPSGWPRGHHRGMRHCY